MAVATGVALSGRERAHITVISTGWVRIQRTDVTRTRLISVPMGAKMQRLEVVSRGQSELLSHFSIPQANRSVPVGCPYPVGAWPPRREGNIM